MEIRPEASFYKCFSRFSVRKYFQPALHHLFRNVFNFCMLHYTTNSDSIWLSCQLRFSQTFFSSCCLLLPDRFSSMDVQLLECIKIPPLYKKPQRIWCAFQGSYIILWAFYDRHSGVFRSQIHGLTNFQYLDNSWNCWWENKSCLRRQLQIQKCSKGGSISAKALWRCNPCYLKRVWENIRAPVHRLRQSP